MAVPEMNAIRRVGVAQRVVDIADTAASMGSGDLDVLATPVLVAVMEAAACDALASMLPAAETTVGVRIEVRHRAPTPIGATVRARATVTSVEGARVAFEIAAEHDVDGVVTAIGSATHTRVIVERQPFLAALATPTG
jgi:predicted thioesterase